MSKRNNGASFFDLNKGSKDDDTRKYPDTDPEHYFTLSVKQLDGTINPLRILKEAKLGLLLSMLESQHNPKSNDFIIKREVAGQLEEVDIEKEDSSLADLSITPEVVVVMLPEDN